MIEEESIQYNFLTSEQLAGIYADMDAMVARVVTRGGISGSSLYGTAHESDPGPSTLDYIAPIDSQEDQ